MKMRPPNAFSRRPDPPAPLLQCPHCMRPLEFHVSVTGGVDAPERWDYFRCHTCRVPMVYRQRTRKLTRAELLPPLPAADDGDQR